MYGSQILWNHTEKISKDTTTWPTTHAGLAGTIPAVKPTWTHSTISGCTMQRNLPVKQGRKENFTCIHLSRWPIWGIQEQLSLHTAPCSSWTHCSLPLATASTGSPWACAFWTARSLAIHFSLFFYQQYWNTEVLPPTTNIQLPFSHHWNHVLYWKLHLRQDLEQIIWCACWRAVSALCWVNPSSHLPLICEQPLQFNSLTIRN